MMAVAALIFLVILVVVCVSDLRCRRSPTRATGAAAAVGVVAMLADDPGRLPGAVLAAGLVAAPLLLASLLRPEGMGMGDVKLMAVIGLYLGWAAVPVMLAGLLVATLAGCVISLARRRPVGKTELPLAPFLAVASIPALLNLLEFPLH